MSDRLIRDVLDHDDTAAAPGTCYDCDEPWPCETHRVLDALLAERDRLRAALERIATRSLRALGDSGAETMQNIARTALSTDQEETK